MIAVLKQVFILYVFLFLGFFLGKREKSLISQTGILSFLLVNVFLPAKVFGTFFKNFTPFYLKGNYQTILFGLAFLVFFHLISIPLSRLFTKDKFLVRVYEYTFTISNYSYLGYALAEGLYGEAGLTDLIVFCIPFAIYTYTVGFVKLTGEGDGLKRVLNPMTFSILIGIIFGLASIPMPSPVESVLSLASGCVGPVSMLLTGITLSGFSVKEMVMDKKSYGIIFLRLVGIPLVVFAICRLLSLEKIMPMAMFMAAMPTGLNTIVFPKSVGEDPGPGARLAFLSHILSCLTLPIWLSLL